MNGPPRYLSSQDIPLSIDTRNKQTWMIAFKGVSFYGADKQVGRLRPHLSAVPIFENYQRFRALPRPPEGMEGISASIGLLGERISQLSLLTVPVC